jgi:DNA-binding transcriptional ArsR family regulator
MDEAQCCAVSEFLSVLSNPHRIRILCALLDGERNVGEIAGAVGLPSAHVSSHLRVLYDRGYVERRRDWRQVFYSLSRPDIGTFITLASRLSLGSKAAPLR